ncbi:hypothetical protein GCM10022198_13340 [Klugiella xanthotipulae]|uniref:Uncharacterized protein n=1 Tax=Klugiella xanthotipulae TaxID=244735 RepID=A0A543I4L1_9MICO|nr:hypothetical protein FB466_0222 [Klugiella xanthotipulae]
MAAALADEGVLPNADTSPKIGCEGGEDLGAVSWVKLSVFVGQLVEEYFRAVVLTPASTW